MTRKLKLRVPTSGHHHQRHASAGVLRGRSEGRPGGPRVSRGRQRAGLELARLDRPSATIIATNVSGVDEEARPDAQAGSRPGAAGPTIRAEWTITLFRLDRVDDRSAPTISIAKL